MTALVRSMFVANLRREEPGISEAEIKRRMVEGTGLVAAGTVPVVSPEDIILAKLAWFQDGVDLELEWALRSKGLDRTYLESWAVEMGTRELLRRLEGSVFGSPAGL